MALRAQQTDFDSVGFVDLDLELAYSHLKPKKTTGPNGMVSSCLHTPRTQKATSARISPTVTLLAP